MAATPKEYDIRESLISLVRVIYGLAIVSGLKTAIDYYMTKNSQPDAFYLILVSVTFFIGIADWLGYHSLCAPEPYRNVYWALADLVYPVIIFFLFYLARYLWQYQITLSVYFLAWVIYNNIWIKSFDKVDPKINRYNQSSLVIFIISIIPILFGIYPFKNYECLSVSLIVIASVLWFITNVLLVDWKIKETGKKT